MTLSSMTLSSMTLTATNRARTPVPLFTKSKFKFIHYFCSFIQDAFVPISHAFSLLSVQIVHPTIGVQHLSDIKTSSI